MRCSLLAALAAAAAPCLPAGAGDDPWADAVISFAAGTSPTPGYADPATTLGPPERCTGEAFDFDSVVSPFNPPFGPDEIVSIGLGGHLVVRFDTPVTDDPANPWGIDLLVFGNAFFVDAAYPAGIVGGLFGAGGEVDVSADGVLWTTVPGVSAVGAMPPLGWRDAGAYDVDPGSVPTDFTYPVDPGLSARDMLGLGEEEVRTAYAGSGGGVGIDLAATGLPSISYVRVRTPADAPESTELDAFADVRPVLPGDANRDGVVNVDDLVAVIGQWGPAGPLTTADADHDLVVGVNDLVIVIRQWSP